MVMKEYIQSTDALHNAMQMGYLFVMKYMAKKYNISSEALNYKKVQKQVILHVR